MLTIPFLLGIALALLVERLHYRPLAIRQAVEAMEAEATQNAARQFEIWKHVWLKNRSRKDDIADSLAAAVHAMQTNMWTSDAILRQPDIQFPKKPNA